MAVSSLADAATARRLRRLAAGLRAAGRWPELEPGEDPAELAASLERAAQALAPQAAPAPSQPLAAAPPPGPLDKSSAPLILHADGGSRGNPGPAGAGAALLDAAGAQVAAWHRYLGKATNNVAEYQALILGLEGALDLGVSQLLVRLDSELLVRQLQGRYQVKSPLLKPLYEQARALCRRFAGIKFQHIPREQNAIADRLANLAMDER
ncbi:MAG: ribonuclease HI family protein [Pseudomonadota bacterium]